MCGQADDPSQHWPGYTPEAQAYEIATRVERCGVCGRVTDPDLATTIDLGGSKGLAALCHVCQDREDPGFEEDDL